MRGLVPARLSVAMGARDPRSPEVAARWRCNRRASGYTRRVAYQSVLITHDGSTLASAVVDPLIPLLDRDARVTLLHVEDGSPGDTAAIGAALEQLEGSGANVERRDVASSDAAGTILDVAEELRPDLVAMSTHGRSGTERWVRGSVAERVLRACPVPLFMVNPLSVPELAVDSVLAPLDTSDNSAQILETLTPLAKAFGARVTLLYVDWDDPTDTPDASARRRELRAADINEWLATPLARVRDAGLDVKLEIAQGEVADKIVALARPGEHDLLAMTTHGRSGPGRWLLGSIAEKVLRECRIPVVLQRIH